VSPVGNKFAAWIATLVLAELAVLAVEERSVLAPALVLVPVWMDFQLLGDFQ
jgi:hypothetical protein